MSKDANFLCELILLMGVKSKTYTLHTPEIHFYYYSLRKDLLPRAITKAFDECSSSSGCISRIFDMTIQSAPHKKMHIRYLNQIYGQTYPSWKVILSLVTVSGKHYYQCRQGPDQWLLKTTLFKNSERVELTKPNVSLWQNLDDFFCRDYWQDGGGMRKATGTKNVAQFKGGKVMVMVTYTTKQKAYGGYLWMPLPLSPSEMHDFALITMK